MFCCPGVHQHISGAAIEASYIPRNRKTGQVCNTANIDDDAMFRRTRKCCGMKRGYKRSTLTACCNVTAAKVDDGSNAGQFSQSGTIYKLHCVACVRPMSDGLTVTADRPDFAGSYIGLIEQMMHSLCITVGQFQPHALRKMQLV